MAATAVTPSTRLLGLRGGGSVSWLEQVFRLSAASYTNILCGTLPWCRFHAIETPQCSGGTLNIARWRWSGRICCSHGHRRCAGDPRLRPVFVDPEGCPRLHRSAFGDLCGHCVLLFPAAGGPADSAVLSNIPPPACSVDELLLTGAILFSAWCSRSTSLTPACTTAWAVLYGAGGVVSMGFRQYGV